ncbi:amino acid permease, partial [Bacillus sp. D-CC]
VGMLIRMDFQQIGIAKAAGIINFVVLTAALSSCNGGLFSTGRMLYTLAQQKKAPERFGRLNKNGIPSQGIVPTSKTIAVATIP